MVVYVAVCRIVIDGRAARRYDDACARLVLCPSFSAVVWLMLLLLPGTGVQQLRGAAGAVHRVRLCCRTATVRARGGGDTAAAGGDGTSTGAAAFRL